MAIPAPGGEAVTYIHRRARSLGLTEEQYEVISRPAGPHDNLGEHVGRVGNEQVVEALERGTTKVLADGRGEISTWYRTVITEPPMGHTEADCAALATSPVTVIGRVDLVSGSTT